MNAHAKQTRTPGETNAGHVPDRTEKTDGEKLQELASEHAAAVGVAQVKTTMPLQGTESEHVAALKATMAEQSKLLADALAANAALMKLVKVHVPDAPRAAELPKLADVLKRTDLDAPVLTDQGWHVPRVTSSNPEQQATAAIITAAVKGAVAASNAKG